MNLGLIFQLMPLAERIQTAIATIQKYMGDPEVPKALALVEKIEADPAVKDALETFKEAAAIIAKSQQPEQHG
jgi:tartrate dehydratase alpha subunit/fumarate hydratase class I-like protein